MRQEDVWWGRRLRLAAELDDEDVDLVGPLSGPADRPSQAQRWLRDAMLDELVYARFPPVHEGRRGTYGSIIVESRSFEGLLSFGRLIGSDVLGPLDAVRELADGFTIFLARGRETTAVMAIDNASEAGLVRVASTFGCHIVQRHPSGAVKVFCPERLLVWENDAWRQKPYGHERWAGIEQAIGASNVAGAAILDFCLHTLSARHIGATLVWCLGCDPGDLESMLARTARSTAIPLRLGQRDHTEALASVLAAVDGACIVDAEGAVMGVEAFLKNSDDAQRYVSASGGTRHNSAARFSFDADRVVVFVVSADGPVTVFGDGQNLLTLGLETPIESLVGRSASRESAVTRSVEFVKCDDCRKTLRVELVNVTGWPAALESVECPVCGSDGIREAMCFEILARVAKPWEVSNESMHAGEE